MHHCGFCNCVVSEGADSQKPMMTGRPVCGEGDPPSWFAGQSGGPAPLYRGTIPDVQRNSHRMLLRNQWEPSDITVSMMHFLIHKAILPVILEGRMK